VDVLLKQQFDKHNPVTLLEARRLTMQQLRQIVANLDQAFMAQIMGASHERQGIVAASSCWARPRPRQ
jgi:hypothetical protein